MESEVVEAAALCSQCLGALPRHLPLKVVRPCSHVLCLGCARTSRVALHRRCPCCYAAVEAVGIVQGIQKQAEPAAEAEERQAAADGAGEEDLVAKKEERSPLSCAVCRARARGGDGDAEPEGASEAAAAAETPGALRLPLAAAALGAAVMPLTKGIASQRLVRPWAREGRRECRTYHAFRMEEDLYWPCCRRRRRGGGVMGRPTPNLELFRFRLLEPHRANGVHGLDKTFFQSAEAGLQIPGRRRGLEALARGLSRLNGVAARLEEARAAGRSAGVAQDSVRLTAEDLQAASSKPRPRPEAVDVEDFDRLLSEDVTVISGPSSAGVGKGSGARHAAAAKGAERSARKPSKTVQLDAQRAIARMVYEKQAETEKRKKEEQVQRTRQLVIDGVAKALQSDGAGTKDASQRATEWFENILFNKLYRDLDRGAAYKKRASDWVRLLKRAVNFDLRSLVRDRRLETHDICEANILQVVRRVMQRQAGPGGGASGPGASGPAGYDAHGRKRFLPPVSPTISGFAKAKKLRGPQISQLVAFEEPASGVEGAEDLDSEKALLASFDP